METTMTDTRKGTVVVDEFLEKHGVKKDELEFTGLAEELSGNPDKRYSKEEVLELIREGFQLTEERARQPAVVDGDAPMDLAYGIRYADDWFGKTLDALAEAQELEVVRNDSALRTSPDIDAGLRSGLFLMPVPAEGGVEIASPPGLETERQLAGGAEASGNALVVLADVL